MGILDRARNDFKKHITSASGAGEDILIETPVGAPVNGSANVRGLAMKHHLSFNTDGQMVNSKNTHITISESDLVELNYPIRNTKSEVSLHLHKVTYTDSSGTDATYLIIQSFPDETLGVITCILGDYE